MRKSPATPVSADVFSLEEIARAAHRPAADALGHLRQLGVVPSGRFVPRSEAIRLVRILSGRVEATEADRTPVTLPPAPSRATAGPLAVSGLLHVSLAAILGLAATLGLLSAQDTEETIAKPPARLVFTVSLGPGGGGGGGGMKVPLPPAPAEREAPVKKISSPVPTPRRIPPPPLRPPYRPVPKPLERPVRVAPSLLERPVPPPEPEVVVAPVVQVAADARTTAEVVDAPSRTASLGPGSGGNAGTGMGAGLGEGQGSGIGEGAGGGTGGGTFRPGSGITPPMLVREVRPQYTPEARRRAIEGDVDLEIVVRRDGTVGSVRVVRGLDSGLDDRAVAAVRQWRFRPSERQGTPVDVVVQVSVAFTLR